MIAGFFVSYFSTLGPLPAHIITLLLLGTFFGASRAIVGSVGAWKKQLPAHRAGLRFPLIAGQLHIEGHICREYRIDEPLADQRARNALRTGRVQQNAEAVIEVAAFFLGQLIYLSGLCLGHAGTDGYKPDRSERPKEKKGA